LESEAPTQKTTNPPGAVDDLKACAAFAKKFPAEVPVNESRKLIQSFLNFARYGSPPNAAKHAITIIMNCDNKKEMHAKELLAHSITDFEYGSDHFLTKLAAISQLVYLAPEECEDDADTILEIAANRVLLNAHPTSQEADVEWMDTPDEDMEARTWALRILVNRLRSFSLDADIKEAAIPVYAMLNRMVKDSGEISKTKTTPQGHKNLQRILAANFLLKLSCSRRLDALLSPADFNELALVTHDPCLQIRKAFATKVMKYLGQNRLPTRYYSILFMCAYEPDQSLKESVITWVRSRRAAFAIRKETILETIFARLLSLLAHHPDFDTDHATLKIMSEYILFYLKSVATQDNLSLIYHVAQRVKGVADGVAPSTKANENLYVLSDLAQTLIRLWEEQNQWSMQSWPGKLKLPAGIFKPLESHEKAQEIADKVWVDEDLTETLESVVRSALRSKKRKATDGMEKSRKKAKALSVKKEKVKSERTIKTPKKKKRIDDIDDDAGDRALQSSGPRRKSDRRSNAKSYVEVSSDGEEDIEASAEQEDDDDQAMAESSEAEKEYPQSPVLESPTSPPPDEDIEMAEEEEEPALEDLDEVEEEAKAENEPAKRGGRPTRGMKPKNGVSSPPPPTKETPAKEKRTVALRGKEPALVKAAKTIPKKTKETPIREKRKTAQPKEPAPESEEEPEENPEEEPEEEPQEEHEEEPELKPTKGAKVSARTTGKSKSSAKSKAKVHEDVASSSPVVNGTTVTRRSGRTRS
jgi:sister-chromatid-cohesion protein PDS5